MTHALDSKITKALVAQATARSPWDVGNKALYDLCARYPHHRDGDEIIGKLWLIGRAYAAAIERRRKKTAFTGDAFYTDYVAPRLIAEDVDSWLAPLSKMRDVSADNISAILRAHARLTGIFSDLTALNKRSLASKYLHFHFPRLFFIYDTRATDALSRLGIRGAKTGAAHEGDKAYRAFCARCLSLRDQTEARFDTRLTPRQLDNLLLEVVRQPPLKSRARRSA